MEQCVYPSGHSFFYSEIRNLELFQMAIRFFYNETQNFEICTQLFIINFVSFLKNRKNYDFEISCFAFLQWETKLEALLNFVLHFIHKKTIERLLPVPTTASSNHWFIVGKTAVKKWVLIKTSCKNNEWKLNCVDKQISKLKFRNNFKNFVFRSQRTNGCLGTILNFVFCCKKKQQMPVSVQL